MAAPIVSASWGPVEKEAPAGAMAVAVSIKNHSPDPIISARFTLVEDMEYDRGFDWYWAYGHIIDVIRPGETGRWEGAIAMAGPVVGIHMVGTYEGEQFFIKTAFDAPVPVVTPEVISGDMNVKIFHPETGSVVVDAAVTIGPITIHTNGDGISTFKNIKSNVYHDIYVSKTGWVDAHKQQLVSTFPANVQVALYKKGEVVENRITGRVTSAEDGGPLQGVKVQYNGIESITNGGGYYFIDNPEPGQHTLRFTALNRIPIELTWTAPEKGDSIKDQTMQKTETTTMAILENQAVKYDLDDYFGKAFKGQLDFLKLKSPSERHELVNALTKFSGDKLTPYQGEVGKLLATHSPITPEEGAVAATGIAGAAGIGLWGLASAGILSETVSAGQVESVNEWLMKIAVQLGLFTAIGTPIAMMYKHGVMTPYSYYLNNLFQPSIPGISDLTTFTVREAFPDTREEWIEKLPEDQKLEEQKEMATLASPFYQKFAHWSKYQGFSKYWSDAYWHSHWVLPSVGQLFEMRYRDLIDDDTLKRMLIINDIHPAWTDRLQATTWKIPRIYDMRAAWEFGDLSEEVFKRKLLDSGFDPADADWILQSQKRFVYRDELGRLRTRLITLFVDGFRDESTLIAELTKLGYRSEVVNLQIQEAQLRREHDEKNDLAKYWLEQFKKRDITEEDCIRELRAIGMVDEVITRKINLTRLKQKPLPTAS